MTHSSDTRLLCEIGFFFGSDGVRCWRSALLGGGLGERNSLSRRAHVCPFQSEVSNMQPPKSPLTFRQPSVISRMFSAHGITLQPDAFTTLPAEILSRTHTPSKIKKTTATIWPYSKHGKHFSTFPPWRTKDKNKQGVITNLALQRLFHKASMRLFYLQLLY